VEEMNQRGVLLDKAYLATLSKEFHTKLIMKHLNFGREWSRTSLNIDFSADGVKRAQDLHIIGGAGYSNDLTKLKKHVKDLPFPEKFFM